MEEAFERVLPDDKYGAAARIIFHIIFAARKYLVISELSEAFEFARNGDSDLKDDLDFQSPFDFEKSLTIYCGSFISVVPIDGAKTVGFFHQKAREFLLKTDAISSASPSSFKHAFDPEYSNELLRGYCISYLKFRGSQGMVDQIPIPPSAEGCFPRPLDNNGITEFLREHIRQHPFLCYAAMNWIFHLPLTTKDLAIREQIAAKIAPLCDISSPVFQT